MIVQYIAALDAICARTPKKDRGADQAMLVLISRMLMTLPGKRHEIDAEAKAEAYAAAVEDVPIWAVEQAIRGWYRGAYGPSHDYEWAPAPATLRALALSEAWKIGGQAKRLQLVLNATGRPEFSEGHRAGMIERVTKLFSRLPERLPRMPVRTDYASRALADLGSRRQSPPQDEPPEAA